MRVLVFILLMALVSCVATPEPGVITPPDPSGNGTYPQLSSGGSPR